MPSKQPFFCAPHLSCLASLSLLHLTHHPTLLDKTLRAGHWSKRPGGEITELNDADLVGSVPQAASRQPHHHPAICSSSPCTSVITRPDPKAGQFKGPELGPGLGFPSANEALGVGGPRLPFWRRLPRLPGEMHKPTTTGLSPGRSATQGVFGHQHTNNSQARDVPA